MVKENKSYPQIKKFRDAAKAVEADQDESKFNDALKRVAKAPPAPKSKDRGDE